MKTVTVTRIFPLGNYKNITLGVTAEIPDEVSTQETFNSLVTDVYRAYFEHEKLLTALNENNDHESVLNNN